MRVFLAALTLASLTACGFRPVYAASEATAGNIRVDDIPGRSGHALRKALLTDLAAGLPNVTETARLNIDLTDTLGQLAFRPDGAASRSNVVATAKYVLELNDTAISGTIRSESAFNVPDAPYGDISAQTAAYDRAMRDLSRRIVQDLRLKLAKDS